ncbi:MAG: MFS transporter [Myxococcota bacterium]
MSESALSNANPDPVSRPGWGTKLAYGIGQMVDGIPTGAIETFLFFYYTQVLGLSGTLAGLAILIALVFDAITDPWIGALSDATESRSGRRHPFLFASVVPLPLCFVALFVPPAELTGPALFGWLLCFAVGVRLSLTLFSVPHMSLGAELSEDYAERTRIVALRLAFGAIGWIAVSGGGFFWFFQASEAFPIGHLDAGRYPAFATSFAIAIAAAALVSAGGTLAWGRRLGRVVRPHFGARQLFRAVRRVFAHAAFRGLVLAGVAASIAVGLRLTLGLHVFTYFWELPPDAVGVVNFVMLGGLLLGFPLWSALAEVIDKRRAMIAGLCGLGAAVFAPHALRIATGWPAADAPYLVAWVAVMALLAAVGGTGAQLALASMMADVTDEHELAHGTREEGLFFGALSVVTKSASGLGHQLAGIGLDAIAFPADAAPGSLAPEVVTGLGWLYGAGVAVGVGLAVFLTARLPLTRARHAEVRRALDARG